MKRSATAEGCGPSGQVNGNRASRRRPGHHHHQNTARVTADLPDVEPANNTETETTLVNTAPVASGPTFTTPHGTAYSGTLPATDTNGDALTFSIVTNGKNGTAGITDAATGAFIYTPNADASGNDTFTFKVNDGSEDSNTATATVTIEPAPSSSGGGGGAFSPLALLLGLAAMVRRRTARARNDSDRA